MTPAAHRLFRLLGQLPAGLAEEDRDALLGDSGYDAGDRLLRIGLAVDRAGRLDLLPPIRDHAARRHRPELPDDAGWRDHYLTLTRVRGAAIGTKAGDGAVARLLPELPNIESAIRAVVAAGRREEAMTAWQGLYRLTTIASAPTPIFSDLAEACHTAGDWLGEADCIYSLGNIALARSDHERARKAYDDAIPLYKQVGSLQGEANCIQSLGDIALARSDHERARKAYEDAIPLYKQVGSLLGEANCIFSLGDIALRRSDHERARKAYDDAIPLYKQVGNLLGEANCIFSLGDIALERSDHERARKAYDDAIPLYKQVGDLQGEANCIYSLGNIALARSDHERARKAYDDAIPLYKQVGDLQGEANCIYSLGNIALARSDHERARKAFDDAIPLFKQVGDLLGEANCIQSLGDIAVREGDTAVGKERFLQALDLYGRIPDPYSIGLAHFRLAHITKGEERAAHVRAARAAWTGINRPDLEAQLDAEFGQGPGET
jgi:tetratricopeptide (TPR) repeat protein